jgi:NADPH:quinone reductase-like Zn-dependent oxidoreductase
MSLLNYRVNQLHFGHPQESLQLESISLGELEEGKVRVEIEATNINPSDLLSIHGVGQYSKNHIPPRVPGFEAVGQVIQSRSPEFSPGERVVVATSGTWQHYIDTSPDNLFRVPQSLDCGYASQLYINALTSWVLTSEIAKLTIGDCLIINAGSSAIGKIFAQLSRSLGFSLIVVTTRPIDYPHDSPYIIDSKQDLASQIHKLGAPVPNVAFDAIGGKAGEALLRTLEKGGTFVNYGTLSLEIYPPSFFRNAKRLDIEFSTFFLRYWEKHVGNTVRREAFEKMLEHFLRHGVRLDVECCMSLKDVHKAIELIESDQPLSGKVILTV